MTLRRETLSLSFIDRIFLHKAGAKLSGKSSNPAALLEHQGFWLNRLVQLTGEGAPHDDRAQPLTRRFAPTSPNGRGVLPSAARVPE